MTSESAIPNNESPTLCGICGGECCRTKPGIEGPKRFLAAPNPAEALRSALASGLWVLAEHYGVPRPEGTAAQPGDMDRVLYYPRPATRAEHPRAAFSTEDEGRECVFLGEGGCLLPFAERPRMCRALEPDVNFECTTSWSRREAALAWLPWQHLIEEARRRQGDAASPEGQR